MPTINPITLSSHAPLPAYCKVLSNDRLSARGHDSTDKPWVPVGVTVKVEAIQPFGYAAFARFTYEGVICFLPITVLQELFLEDDKDIVAATEDSLWAEVHERLTHLTDEEATYELDMLLENIKHAGQSSEIAIAFLEAWLSQTRMVR